MHFLFITPATVNATVDRQFTGTNVFLSPPGSEPQLFFDALALLSEAAANGAPDLLCALEEGVPRLRSAALLSYIVS